MRNRILAILVPGLALGAAAAGQPQSVPKTPWGDPDLQGIWPGNMGVPMQRPKNLGERTALNEGEYAQRVAQAQRAAAADNEERAPKDARVGIGPPSYWTERGKPTRQASLIIDPPDGRLPPLTPEAEKLRREYRGGRGVPAEWAGQADTYEDLNLYYRCITRGLTGSIIPVVYNNGNQILQAPGYVVIRNEMIHEARVIPLDGRPHIGAAIREYMGDSRGHWEGNTLVIETTNFTDKTSIGSNGVGYNGEGGKHSEALKIVERLTRVDGNTLHYQATVDDPKTWTRPWTMLIELKRDDKYQFLEYACHEGNYAMKDILAGARAGEGGKGR
ncbi:MAG: hypothetical protein C5B51_27670 [Terriglobia bacterium]|nr:MAG: hypothetical protein C5B51_27670 [Terriglobia bacterium]